MDHIEQQKHTHRQHAYIDVTFRVEEEGLSKFIEWAERASGWVEED